MSSGCSVEMASTVKMVLIGNRLIGALGRVGWITVLESERMQLVCVVGGGGTAGGAGSPGS